MEVKTIKTKKFSVPNPSEIEEKAKKLQKEYWKPIKGKFEFIDARGGWIEFTDRFFKNDLIMTYKIFHNEECELPMGLVRRLNNTYQKIRTPGASTPDKATEMTGRGVPSTFQIQSRIRFTPLDVM